ncbi:hypothetical protein BU24DRAFT_236726 [Aaosphaeria arxii CBS 175.79]|uniref:Uncharacterized protein n=1 Tax=Aaosphaeria arxii CBS 175.79 TaxID=1450172 RepID=A0A6A5XJT6_9PLEO|nr:uncharacterized protein BU24DRAFT_236726 [Aaosphaeria arxii CBS 175.79]KAF2013392.1 hypothetical protein BU24DRAFT_236726 [Aaosphaeria arxii CBS 175.79]
MMIVPIRISEHCRTGGRNAEVVKKERCRVAADIGKNFGGHDAMRCRWPLEIKSDGEGPASSQPPPHPLQLPPPPPLIANTNTTTASYRLPLPTYSSRYFPSDNPTSPAFSSCGPSLLAL